MKLSEFASLQEVHNHLPWCKSRELEAVGQFADVKCNCDSRKKYVIDGVEYDMNDKPSNPKDIIGSNKVPLGLVPATTMSYLAIGHAEGHLKYGLTNWREAGVRISIYLDAVLRHVEKLKEGEWADPETTVPHLANALACLSIIVDAHHAGKLIDDRPKSIAAGEAMEEMAKVLMHLKAMHADKKPTDYFITGPKERE